MVLALNNLQKMICHKPNQPTNQNLNIYLFFVFFDFQSAVGWFSYFLLTITCSDLLVGDLCVSQNLTEFCVLHSSAWILVWAYTILQYGQI